MGKHSYYRSKGYSTGEMLSEGKLDVWELPVREPLWLLEEEEDDEEEYEGFLKALEAQEKIWEASQNPPEPKTIDYDEF